MSDLSVVMPVFNEATHLPATIEALVDAVERSGFECEACLAVEDSERGLISAHGAGIRCVVVPTALTRGGNFADAHKVLGSITEILTML